MPWLRDEILQTGYLDQRCPVALGPMAGHQLAEGGEEEFVLDLRRKFQRTMRDDLVAAVEELGGRKVVAFMSDSTIEPDRALESFVLE